MTDQPAAPLLATARAAAVCGALGVVLALARAEWRTLPAALASRGLSVVPDSVRWLDPPGLGARRALFLARRGDAPSDVYVATARTGPDARVITLRDVSNLTRSHNAAEESLVADGRFAAYATRVGGELVAVTLLDTRGERTEPGEHPRWDARVRSALTRWQQTGRPRGYGLDRFELVAPLARASLALRGGEVEVRGGRETLRIDAEGPHVVAGESLVRERPRHSAAADNWLTWAVDTVRALPWVGPIPIAWAESLAFRTRNAVRTARVAASGTDTQREVAADLGDVLNVRASGPLEGPVAGWPPPPVRGTVEPVVPHEGEWTPLAQDNDPFVATNPGAPPPMYVTFVRTDRERPDARIYVVVWDARQIELHAAPGSQEPIGATGETGSGAIPRDEATMTRLVAGFNGAFQGLHGEYGMYGEGALLLPPKPYAATVALTADGATAFGSWPPSQREVPDTLVEFRQNLTALVEQGQYNPWRRDDWGAVLFNPPDLRTARSGLCLTAENHVAFFWGDDISPRTLGAAMLAARCAYGVHLDMNGPNTGFELYRVGRTGTLPPVGHRLADGYEGEGSVSDMQGLTFRARKLVRGMPHHAPRYIYRNPRDFFYLLLRPTLPGPALSAPVHPAQPGEGSWHVAGLGELPFPWPMARTRVRPDPARAEHWVNLVRLDARRLALAPPDASQGVVARVVGGSAASDPRQLRIAMTQGPSGPRWAIGTAGDGLLAERLRPGAAVLRGACVDASGYLVLAVADRALPELVARALDLAGCGTDRVALPGGVLVLPSGQTATGEGVPSRGQPVLALVAREFVGARRIFADVTPVPRQVWYPLQSRRVRYFPNPGNNVTVQVRLAGQQPMVLALPGVGAEALRQAYPDGGAPPTLREQQQQEHH